MTGPSRHDLIVLGAGPAGARAALAAVATGLDVVLVDEQPAAGGQVWRAPASADSTQAPISADRRSGDQLREALANSSVTCAFRHRVWSVTGSYRVDALGPTGAVAFAADHLIAATGAHERIIPFAGWTLPGVMGLAAATILLKSEARLPGARVVVAGRGPLLAAVAAGIVAKGGTVAAVLDRTPLAGWRASLPGLMTQPRLLAQGAGWTAKVLAKRVPWLFGHHVLEAQGREAISGIMAAKLDGSGQRSVDCDALVVGDGLVPGGEIARLFRVPMRFDRLRGGWVPELTQDFETAMPGLFCVGDGAGVRGALMATISGEIAGLAVAARLGRNTGTRRLASLKDSWARGEPFSNTVAAMMAGRPEDVRCIEPDTVVCRCEDVRRRDIEAAIDAGASDINQLKHFTRCGMGPCQGRMCGDVVQELMAARIMQSRDDVGFWTGRPPLRPVPFNELVGDFSYADIPVPEPAPL